MKVSINQPLPSQVLVALTSIMPFFGTGCTSSAIAADEMSNETRLDRLESKQEIRQLAFCYGQGLDDIAINFSDVSRGQVKATERYEDCFVDDVTITVFALGNLEAPLRSTTGIDEWVAFASSFFQEAGYSATRHLMSNFDVTLTGTDTAVMTSYASIPHFILDRSALTEDSATQTLEFMIARYEDEVARDTSGKWRVVEKTVYLEEIWRGVGFFPGGQAGL